MNDFRSYSFNTYLNLRVMSLIFESFLLETIYKGLS